MPFSNNYKKLGKNKAFLLQDLENTQHTWASQVGSLVGGERVQSTWGFALLESISSRGNLGSLLLMNLKHKSSNLKHRKKKKQVAQMGSYPHQPRSLKQRRLV